MNGSEAVPPSASLPAAPTLRVENLSVYLRSPAGEVQVVRDVSFTIGAGEAVGMVGESGSGKSVTGLALMRLLDPAKTRVEGRAYLGGRDILALPEREMRAVRGREMSMVFQESATALDPVFTVGTQLVETIRAHRDVSVKQARLRAIELLDAVGIAMPARRFGEYPHQMSGGMKQRVMIAMALACDPDLIIADEPTTAVDVTIQAQILDLLGRLSRERGVAILFITHDLGVVAEFCSRALTMYAGEVVEVADVAGLLAAPAHPYTAGLIRAIPRADDKGRDLYEIRGTVPSPTEMPGGCRFRPRCDHAGDVCGNEQALVTIASERKVRCVRSSEIEFEGVG
ncbi:ABC transporter ATP-binding protein [Nocardioides sp. LHD-245]|uniref:ABC transporter ATP-binding protein n=1 Tax=Nocardioides sp. LHD-245 TaxID=3051387 RepID=UPI0027E18632|nr:ABC transporter ATP-binding protein [Nocardioides sp. LHD-245]